MPNNNLLPIVQSKAEGIGAFEYDGKRYEMFNLFGVQGWPKGATVGERTVRQLVKCGRIVKVIHYNKEG